MIVRLLPSNPAEPPREVHVSSFKEIQALVGAYAVPIPQAFVQGSPVTFFCDEDAPFYENPMPNPYCEGLFGNVVIAPLDWNKQLEALSTESVEE
jgi:hypothetical protein